VSNGLGALGVVICDLSSRVLAALAKHYTNLVDALTGEFLAARDGLWLVAHHGCERVVLESDNLQLVIMMQASVVDQSALFGLRQEIQELDSAFISIVFSFVHREDNICATLLSVVEPELVWVDNFPRNLLDVVGNDCNTTVVI
jgi:hypothetical protein